MMCFEGSPGRVILSILFNLAIINGGSAEKNAKLVLCTTENDNVTATMMGLMMSGVDMWRARNEGRECTYMVMEDNYDAFKVLAAKHNLSCTALNEDLLSSTKTEEDENDMKKAMGKAGDIVGTFATYDEIVTWMKHEEKLHCDKARVVSIGRTHENRRMYIMEISDELRDVGKTRYRSKKPIIWIDAGLHAREWISVSSIVYVVHKLLYDDDILTQKLLEKFEFNILIVANPDGYAYTFQQGGDLLEKRLWRKNRSPAPAGANKTCIGVDLNRNFGFHWGESGVVHDPCSDIYPGSRGFSTKEASNMERYILNLINVQGRTIVSYMTFHTYGQLVLVPYAYTADPPEDDERLRRLGEHAAEQMGEINMNEYLVVSVPEIFPSTISGGSFDWAKGVAKIERSFTFELFPDFTNPNGFITEVENIIPVGEEAWKAVRDLSIAFQHE